MGYNNSLGGGNALRKHVETATKTGVLQYDNRKLKEVRCTGRQNSNFDKHLCSRSILAFVYPAYVHYH